MPRPAFASVVRVVCLASLAISLGLSATKIVRAPITYDEAYSYLRFARQPYSGILRDYTFTNNHILHTVLLRALTQAFGDSLVVLRLPAFAGAMAFLLALWRLHKRLGTLGQLWAAVVALTPTVVDYGALARSYTLGCAFSFWALYLLSGIVSPPRAESRGPGTGPLPRLVGAGMLLGAAIGCVPVFGLFALGLTAAYLLITLGSAGRRGLTGTLARVALVGIAVLIPVILIYWRIRFDPRGWSWGHQSVGEFVHHFWINAYDLKRLARDHAVLVSALVILFALWGLATAWRRAERTAALILATFLLTFAALAACRVGLEASWPFARNMLFLVPLALFAPLYVIFGAPATAWTTWKSWRPLALLLLLVNGVFTVARFDPFVHREWRSNAGVPASLAAVAVHRRDDTVATLGIPWQLDVCVEYALLHRPDYRIRMTDRNPEFCLWLSLPDAKDLGVEVLFTHPRSGLVLARCGRDASP